MFTFLPLQFILNRFPNSLFLRNGFSKKFCKLFDGDQVSQNTANVVISTLKFLAHVDSYLFSPNIMIPLQFLRVVGAASSSSSSGIDKAANVIFSTIVLGITCKYTYDGTLRKLSDDLYSFSKEAKNTVERLRNNPHKTVTFYEPIQIRDNPSHRVPPINHFSLLIQFLKRFLNASFFVKKTSSPRNYLF